MAVKGRGSRRDSRNESYSDLSSQFERFSKSLDDHSKALNDFINQFDKTTKSYNKGNTKDRDRTMEEGFSDISRSLDRSSVAQEKSLTTYQKVGKSIEVVIKNVGNMIKKELVTAYNGVKSSYTNHLSSITAQLNITNDQYRKLYNESSSYFKDQGLSKQFSPVDFAEALEGVLDTGLRGDLAKTTAYQNLMINKLLPAVSVNTASMRRMTKTVGKGFSDNLLAFSKYTESALGAEGISEGKLNSMLDTLETNILYSSRGSSEQANASINALEASISYLEKAGLDSSKFVDMMYSATTGQIGDSPVGQAILGMFSQGDIDKLMTDPKKIAQITEDYMKFLASSGHDANLLQAKNAALGLDQDEAKRAVIFQDYGGDLNSISNDISELLEGYNKDSILNRYKTQMKDGQYQSADDALTKREENFVTGIATATSTIARFDEVLSTVISTLGSLAEIWLLNKAVSGASGGKGLFNTVKGFFGKGAGTAGTAGKVAGSSGGKIASAAGKALPAASLAAGIIWTTADAISAGKNASDKGMSGLDVAGASARGALTGQKTMSESEKVSAFEAALYGEKRSMDWGAVAKNAGKGGLIGAGAGGLSGNPIVAAIGGAIGIVAGGLSSAIDQAVTNYNYNKLADSVNELNSSLSAASESLSNYESVVKESIETTKNLNQWDELSEDQQETLFKQLRSKYPSVLGSLSDQSEMTDKYVKLLKDLISQEEIRSRSEAKSAADKAKEDADVVLENLDKVAGDTVTLQQAQITEALTDFMNRYEDRGKITSEIFDEELSKIASDYGLSKDEVLGFAEKSGLVRSYDVNGNRVSALMGAENSFDKDIFASGFNVRVQGHVTNSYKTREEAEKAAKRSGGSVEPYYDSTLTEAQFNGFSHFTKGNFDNVSSQTNLEFFNSDDNQRSYAAIFEAFQDSVYPTIDNYASLLLTQIERVNSELTDGTVLGEGTSTVSDLSKEDQDRLSGDIAILKSYGETLSETIKGYGDQAKIYQIDGEFRDYTKKYEDLLKVVNLTYPSFKVGLGTVPYDDYIANLHRGEMVLTAQQAQDYRDSSNVSAEVVGKIASQTESIVEILGNIFSLLSQTTRVRPVASTIPSSVVSFQGV